MTRVAADRGSRESPDGSVRDVAAQMPPVRIRIQNGRAIDDIALSATTPNPAETTSTVYCRGETGGPERARVIRSTVTHAQADEHAEGRQRNGHHWIEQASASLETEG